MRVAKWLTAAAMAAMLVSAALAAEESGPAKDSTPMLMIRPANVEGDAYCLTCKAGLNPAVVAFVTKNDEATQKLVAKLDEQAKAGHDSKLNVTVVVVGPADQATGLTAWAKEHHVAVPTAVVSQADEGLAPWKLNAKVDNTVVFLNHHKVDHSAANVTGDQVVEQVQHLLHPSTAHHAG